MTLIRISASFQRINDITEHKNESSQTICNNTNIRGKIEFRNVYFRYSQFEPFILEDVSFIIASNENILLKGTSGVGKSTIVKLILGHYKATYGEILIDDIPLKEHSYKQIRKNLSVVVTQSSSLFNKSILENIILDSQYIKDKFLKILKESDLIDLMDSLPQKELTTISEGATDFSNGQKQKLLLARALYKDSNVLILDEATNALDKKSEDQIFNQLQSKPSTKIIISHREIKMEFDKIFCLNNGKIILEKCNKVDKSFV